jgi:hypothetical protein
MPQIKDVNENWWAIWDVVTREDGQIMSFKTTTSDNRTVTLEAKNIPQWEGWETAMNAIGRPAGAATIGSAFGPVGAFVGLCAGAVSFFKSYDDRSPGYIDRASNSTYFDRFFNTRDASRYRG